MYMHKDTKCIHTQIDSRSFTSSNTETITLLSVFVYFFKFRFSWLVYDNITSKLWFEFFILCNIIAVGIMTGIDLEMSENRAHKWDLLSLYVSRVTLVVFFLEVVLKLLSEGFEPWGYFFDRY